MVTALTLLANILVILLGCKLFSNGVEWFGRKLNLGDGSVGSILAAVGTALPEAVVPIIAIVFGATQDMEDIGIGAIVGSSFMLATLALFVTGVAVAVFSASGRRTVHVKADPTVLTRDLRFFFITYATTIGAAMLDWRGLQLVLAFGLVMAYAVYVYRTITGDSASDYELEPLYFQRKASPPSFMAVAAQMAFAVVVIIVGAKFFVAGIEQASAALAIPTLVFSLLVTPFATELPEKFNSIMWVREGKDTLALGNITGAMVFQSCILPAIGIMLTPWELTTPSLVAAGLGLVSVGAAYVQLRVRGNLHYRHLIGMGLLYLGFAAYAIMLATK
ncbi:MAG TPA: sodium:calcium antiporter [Chloroflexota bacterium]|nr:sodium:calcium antiporter [Chloroflexota bacterium]